MGNAKLYLVLETLLLGVLALTQPCSSFVLQRKNGGTFSAGHQSGINNQLQQRQHQDALQPLSMIFGKMFEESGPLGKGITVGKVQVALSCLDRSSSSIFGILEDKARNTGDSPAQLSRMTNDVCLALLRKNEDWVGACSTSEWFSQNDAGKAESLFNEWANREAAKFEKEYIPGAGSEEKGGGPTTAVVSLVVEIQGDTTKFDGAGFSIEGTKEVLSSLASDAMVDSGYCLNAVEVFWTPSERNEVLTSRDVILDFPELIDI